MKKSALSGISVFTLFAAATLCAEETDTSTAPELGGATSAAVRALIHIIGDAVKIEAKLIKILINATDGVDEEVLIYGHNNEEQKGDGITFTDGGGYSGDDIVTGYHIKDLYPEASNSGQIDVKGIEVYSPYSGKEAVCGIYHEQAGNGARQGLGKIAVSEKVDVSYFEDNASVAGIWQKGSDTSEPPYFYESVKLNGVNISATGSGATAYGIVQDGNAHIDKNLELHGSVSSSRGNAFGVKGGVYGGNILADLTVSAGESGVAAGIYLAKTAGSIDGSIDADGNRIMNSDGSVKKAKLTVTSNTASVGILLGGESTFDSDGNVTGETKGGNVSGALANYDISVESKSQNPENMAIGVYMHNGASVDSMSDLKISAISYYGPAAGFVYDNTGTETMSAGTTISRLDITAETFTSVFEESDCGRTAGILIGKDVDFKVDDSSITVTPGNGRDSYGLAYGKNVSGDAENGGSADDGGVGIFNHTNKDSSGLEITNSQIVAYACNTATKDANAYGLFVGYDKTYDYEGNEFTAISPSANAYGLYAAGAAKVSNLTTLTAKDSYNAYGVYLFNAAEVDATSLKKVVAHSNSVGGSAYGIFVDNSANGEFSNFTGDVDVLSFCGTAYGAYVNGLSEWDLSSATIKVKRTESAADFESVKNENNIGSTDSSDESGTAYGVYVTREASVSVKNVSVSGTGNLVGIWAGTGTSVSLADGATIDATGGDALASDGDMTIASLGSAQLAGNASVAGTLHFTQGEFLLNAGTIAAETWKIGSEDANGIVTTAKVELAGNTVFEGNELTFYIKKPETRAMQDAVISVAEATTFTAEAATFTALATTINVVLDHNGEYGVGDVITLIGGNYDLGNVSDVVVRGSDLGYTYGNVAGGWGITFIPEPSAFGLLAGLGMLTLAASRRRRK